MQHRLRTLSFIPWDAGKAIPKSFREPLDELIVSLGFRRHRVLVAGTEIVLFRISTQKFHAFLRLFADGTAQFILVGKSRNYRSSKDIDPDVLNQWKWRLHKEILTSDPKWEVLRDVVVEIRKYVRSIFDNEPVRSSASESWEASGFSYVFTVFILRARRREINSDMLSVVLAPKRVEFTESYATFEDSTDSSSRVTTQNINDLCLADLPSFSAWYSWATSVCIYANSGLSLHRYLLMLSVTQRAWFRFYLLSRHLDELSPRVTQKMPVSEIDRLNIEINSIHREAFSLRNLNRSMVSDLDISAENVVWRRSRLANIYDDICEKSDVLRRELEQASDRRGNSRLRYLEVILLTLTLIQAMSAYIAIRHSEALSTSEVVGFVILGMVALTVILWRR